MRLSYLLWKIRLVAMLGLRANRGWRDVRGAWRLNWADYHGCNPRAALIGQYGPWPPKPPAPRNPAEWQRAGWIEDI